MLLLLMLAATLVAQTACDPALDSNSTVPQPGSDANSTRPESGIGDLSGPVTPAALLDHIEERARRLAAAPYSPPERVGDALAGLDYDQHRSIRYRPEAALWRGESRFEVQLFHPGFIFREPVRVHIVEDGRIATLAFDPELFRYEGPAESVTGMVSPDLGYAGFRLHYPLNDPAIKDEVVAFLGASYFRLLGQGHVYGLSSRGLAVDIAMDTVEEFPVFREFWLFRPGPDANRVTLGALLDSPSVAGAYLFELEPGAPTAVDVEARLHARGDVAKLGVAPMSSMFLYDRDRAGEFDDFRPEVHDSDGLLVETADGEWIWRPLANGPGVQVAAFPGDGVRGFGLVQRDRDFRNYLDPETNYHRRPSEWVAIGDDWGPGRVELLSFHTLSEFADNIAAYWVPDEPLRARQRRQYRYRLLTFDSRLPSQTLAEVRRTASGQDALPGSSPSSPGRRRFIVDFADGELGRLGPNPPIEARTEVSGGQISDMVVHPLPDGHGWRAAFRLQPGDARAVDVRLHLELEGRRLSETWSYSWHPDASE